jgi:hypothetical protein
LKEQNIAIEIIVESTGLSYEAIERIWANNVLGLRDRSVDEVIYLIVRYQPFFVLYRKCRRGFFHSIIVI